MQSRTQATRFAFLAAGLVVISLVLGGTCQRKPTTSNADEKQLVVFAAASLREVFTQLASGFKTRHPGVEVTFNFAGSQELRTQIEHGAPADVFASADRSTWGRYSVPARSRLLACLPVTSQW